jgi:hypothetical protein
MTAPSAWAAASSAAASELKFFMDQLLLLRQIGQLYGFWVDSVIANGCPFGLGSSVFSAASELNYFVD